MFKMVFVAIFCLICLPLRGWAVEIAHVGGYPFLPFVDKSSGVTFDLIKAMNDYQSEYRFEFVPTSANRRYRDMADGVFTVIFFENVGWGWDAKTVDSSNVYLSGDGEVYVALNAPGRGQSYFDTLQDKAIIGVLGYHYAFADFEADQLKLSQKFKILFSQDNEVSLRKLLTRHGDVAVITRSFLQGFLERHPESKGKFLVSERFDQVYTHTALVKKGSRPTVGEINALLSGMGKAGVLKKIWVKHGIAN
ncbi:MAG TPA: transporter substrate-binding domain-containing protein [Rhodocyclaceae bacterium]|nr:transporter substrate-binding domain-containing protein [Rhodocyclaceae bacterium]